MRLKLKEVFNKRALVLIVFIVGACILKKSLFIEGDGFNSQIMSVLNRTQYSLSKIHMFRFLVVSPFYFLGKNNSVVQAILLYIYAIPVLKRQNFKVYTLILIIMLLFSYRTIIVSLSLPYFHIYQENKKKKYLLVSFLFSILSSATVLNFIIIYIIYNYKIIYKKAVYLLTFFIILLPSFKHKLLFFTKGGTGYFETMAYRSFLIEAVITKNYIRIAISIVVFLIFFLQFLTFLKNGRIKLKNMEKILPVIFLFMEGLGVYSYLIEYVILVDKILKKIK